VVDAPLQRTVGRQIATLGRVAQLLVLMLGLEEALVERERRELRVEQQPVDVILESELGELASCFAALSAGRKAFAICVVAFTSGEQ
jgi:hypothetical protein